MAWALKCTEEGHSDLLRSIPLNRLISTVWRAFSWGTPSLEPSPHSGRHRNIVVFFYFQLSFFFQPTLQVQCFNASENLKSPVGAVDLVETNSVLLALYSSHWYIQGSEHLCLLLYSYCSWSKSQSSRLPPFKLLSLFWPMNMGKILCWLHLQFNLHQ